MKKTIFTLIFLIIASPVSAQKQIGKVELMGRTATRILQSDAILNIETTDLSDWISGTTNQIIVTDDMDGTVTLSTPQDIHTGASPTFAGLTDTGLTASRIVSSDGSKLLSSTSLSSWLSGTANEIEVADDGDGTATVGLPDDVTISSDLTVGSPSGTITVNGNSNLIGDLRIQPGTADYTFTTCGGTCLSLQNNDPGESSILRMFAADGDGTDSVFSRYYGLGTPADLTNSESLAIGYDSTTPDFHIYATASGTGNLRDFLIGNDTYPSIATFAADGTMTVGDDLTVTNDLFSNTIDVTTTATVGTDLTMSNLTASRLTYTDGSKILSSVTLPCSWYSGTTDQITCTDDLDGTATLSTPQDIATTSSPTFAGMTLSGISQYSILFAGASGVVSQDAAGLVYKSGMLGVGTNAPAAFGDFMASGASPGLRVSGTDTWSGASQSYSLKVGSHQGGASHTQLTTDLDDSRLTVIAADKADSAPRLSMVGPQDSINSASRGWLVFDFGSLVYNLGTGGVAGADGGPSKFKLRYLRSSTFTDMIVADTDLYVSFPSSNVKLPSNTYKFLYGAGDNMSVGFDGSDGFCSSENITANDEFHFTNWDLVSFDSPIQVAAYQRQVQIAPTTVGLPANLPTSVDVGTAGGYQFASSGTQEELHFQFEVSNDWAGDDITIEIDWLPDSGAMTNPDAVKWTCEYRSIATGESIVNGTQASVSSTYNTTTAQYVVIHSPIVLPYNDANQPLTKLDHVYAKCFRDTTVANDFSGTVVATAFEIEYNSIGIPTSN